jgi:hypothetical protein
MIVLRESNRRRIMNAYAAYYNAARTHLVLGKDAPLRRPIERIGSSLRSRWSVGCITDTLGFDFQQGQLPPAARIDEES